MSFGKKLRILIEERALTQKEVGRQLNLAPSTIGSYIHDAREPDFTTLKLIADYFDVSIDYLLDHDAPEHLGAQEAEMMRIFHNLSEEQQRICIAQTKVFLFIE